jgi:hypothetical protein
MMATPELNLKVDALNKAFSELMAVSGKSAKDEAMTTFKGVMKGIFSVTPPMRGDIASGAPNFAKGKKAGQGTIEADLRKAFLVPGFGMKVGAPKVDPLSWYLPLRSPTTKRFREQSLRRKGRFSGQFVVSQSQFNQIKARMFQRVGALAAGWVSLAKKLGVSPAKWVEAHPNTGSATLSTTDTFTGFKGINPADFPDKSLQSRINYGLQHATVNLEARTKRIVEANAKKTKIAK